MTAWTEGTGLWLWGTPIPGRGQFTRREAEAWLAAGRRLVASDHEKLLTEQGKLWSPGGEHKED